MRRHISIHEHERLEIEYQDLCDRLASARLDAPTRGRLEAQRRRVVDRLCCDEGAE